jgi:hypothetical protein
MTFNEEAKQIHAEVAALKPGRDRKYTKQLRERVLDWMQQARDEGLFEIEASRRIGVPLTRIEGWRAADRERANTIVPVLSAPRATSETALVPVCICDESPFGPSLCFWTPSGYRIEGLSFDQALGLLRAFAGFSLRAAPSACSRFPRRRIVTQRVGEQLRFTTEELRAGPGARPPLRNEVWTEAFDDPRFTLSDIAADH